MGNNTSNSKGGGGGRRGRHTGKERVSNHGIEEGENGMGDEVVKHEKKRDGDPKNQGSGNVNMFSSATRSSMILEESNSSTSIIEKYVISSEQLGSGRHGVVRRCSNIETGERFAVKSITKSKLKRICSLLQEIEILKMVDHPNIIRLYEVYEDEKYIHLIMELCEGGELFDRIASKTETAERHYSERDAAKIMKKLLSGIEYCHNVQNICHRDLKPENFLFKTMDNDNDIKIIDFGLSQIGDRADTMLPVRVGTPYYMAPEIFVGNSGKACDLWGLGVITFILLSGYPPFSGDTTKEIYSSIQTGIYSFPSPEWDEISDQAKSFISCLLVKDSIERMTASDAMKHPWLNDPDHLTYNHVPPRVQTHQSYKRLNLSHRLRRFISMNKMKRVALNVIAEQLSESKHLGHIKEAFHNMDENGDGKITVSELRESLRIQGMEMVEEDAEKLLHVIDVKGRNTLDYTEFIAATMQRRQFVEEGHMKAAFSYFDVENEGVISKKDLLEIFGNEEHVHEILDLVDVNNDGIIDYNEFRDMMLAKERHRPS